MSHYRPTAPARCSTASSQAHAGSTAVTSSPRCSAGHVTPPWSVGPSTVALAHAEPPHTRFLDLRHSAATFLLSQDFGLEDVENSLGHSTIALTSNTDGMSPSNGSRR